MTAVAPGDLIVGSTNGYFEHRSPDGLTLIDRFGSDLGHFNQVRGMGIDVSGNSYFCMERIDNAKRVGSPSSRGRPGIIKLDNTFQNLAAHEIDWGVFDYGLDSATSTTYEPMDIVHMADGTFAALMHIHYPNATRPLGHNDWMGIWKLSSTGAVLARNDAVNTDFDGFNGVFFGRIAVDCLNSTQVFYTHYSQTVFKFDMATMTNLPYFKKLRDRRLPFTFGDVKMLGNGAVLIAMSNGFASSSGVFGTAGIVFPENLTKGPRDAITARSNRTSFFADQGFYSRNQPGNTYAIREHRVSDGVLLTTIQETGATVEPSAMDTFFNACGVAAAGAQEYIQVIWVG